MKQLHLPSLPAAAACSAACLALLTMAAPAQAQVNAGARVSGSAQGPWAGRAAYNAQGANADAAGRRRIASDGQGNVDATAGSGFSTAAGAQGLRARSFSRNADSSVAASNQASASTAGGGSAQRSGSFTRGADGSASGERSTTLTNGRTGVTFDGSSTYTRGSGFSRSASCTDAAGNSVSCGSR